MPSFFFWQVPLFFYFVILTVFCNFFRHFDEFFPSVFLTNTRGFLSLAELLPRFCVVIIKAENAHLSTSFHVIIALVMIIYYLPHFDKENPRKTRDLKVQKRDKNDGVAVARTISAGVVYLS